MLEKFGIAIGVCFGVAFVGFMAFLFFVWAPVMMYAEAECLRTGYPKAYVTVGLERYCSTLDGAVTVRVTKQ